jgi:hypothetical protein
VIKKRKRYVSSYRVHWGVNRTRKRKRKHPCSGPLILYPIPHLLCSPSVRWSSPWPLSSLLLPLLSSTPLGLLYASIFPFPLRLLIQAPGNHNSKVSNYSGSSRSPLMSSLYPAEPLCENHLQLK